MKYEDIFAAARWQSIARLSLIYCLAGLCGWAFHQAGMPLPWMIGPLIGTALLTLSGLMPVHVPVRTRPIGQMIVSTQVGLAFSPQALEVLVRLAPLMIGIAVTTALSGLLSAFLLKRLSGQGLAPSVLACLPASPVESAILSERLGYDPMPVILGQTVRIAGVVILIPVALYLVDGWPDRTVTPIKVVLHPAGLAISAVIALAAALLFRRLRIPNPYFLGPLTASAALTAAGTTPHPVPPGLLVVAQLILGTWLGATFQRHLFASAGRLVFGSILSSLALVTLSAGFAALFSLVTELHWEVLVLGAAPGGVTEMALTARFLGEDIALVAAFQITRIFLILPNIPWMVRLIHRLESSR